MLCAARRFRPNKPRQVGPSLGGQYFWFFDCKLRWLLVPIRLKTLRNQCIFTRFWGWCHTSPSHHFQCFGWPFLGESLASWQGAKRCSQKGAHFTQAPAGVAPSTRRKMQLPNGRFQNLELFNFVQIMRQTSLWKCHGSNPEHKQPCILLVRKQILFVWKTWFLKICENSAVWVHVVQFVQLCYKFIAFQTWVEQKVRQAMLQRQNEFAFGCSIFYLLAVTLQRMLSSWTSHHHIISSLPLPSSTHFCTPRMYLA